MILADILYIRRAKTITPKLTICVKTDIGLKRAQNEDAYLVMRGSPQHSWLKGGVFAVADGMSGHMGGSIASSMAIKSLRSQCMELLKGSSLDTGSSRKEIIEQLENIVLAIDRKISKAASASKKLNYMGTTLSLLLIHQNCAVITHVGDSRVYMLRKGMLEQITYDDTMAQLSVEMGYMDEDVAKTHSMRHLLTQALGQTVDEVHTYVKDIQKGDVFLLCTDGLYGELSDEKIRTIMQCNHIKTSICDKLIKDALGNGGRDNVTVIVIEIN